MVDGLMVDGPLGMYLYSQSTSAEYRAKCSTSACTDAPGHCLPHTVLVHRTMNIGAVKYAQYAQYAQYALSPTAFSVFSDNVGLPYGKWTFHSASWLSLMTKSVGSWD
jgi:hypothetical protein